MPSVALVASRQWSHGLCLAATAVARPRPATRGAGQGNLPSRDLAQDLLHAFVLGLLATLATWALMGRAAPAPVPVSVPVQVVAPLSLPVPVAFVPATDVETSAEAKPTTQDDITPTTVPAADAGTLPRAVFTPRVERWRTLAQRAVADIDASEGVTLDPDLLLALVQAESNGDPDATSDAGAAGLVQLRAPAFADMARRYPRLFSRQDRYNPYENVLAGGLYLVYCARVLDADLADKAGLLAVLNAYNYGPTALLRLRTGDPDIAPLPHGTALHASRVLAALTAAGDMRTGR